MTPGDTYQWFVGADDLPRAWRMYVKVLRLKGLELTWEDWQPLSTGALVATRHKTAGFTAVRLSGVAGAPTLAALEPGPDPFAPLFAGPAQ